MRRRIIGGAAAIAIVLVGCGDGDTTETAAQEERLAELEAELDATRADAAELLAENEQLRDELRVAEAAPDDEVDPGPVDEGEPDTGDPDGDGSAVPQPQRERSAEGLSEQLRTLFLPGREEPLGYEPGTTDWRSAELPDGLDGPYDTPGALAFDLAAALDADLLGMDGWETTTRVLYDEDDPDLAYVAVLSWGLADDAVAGRDLRVTVTGGEGAWQPGGAEERFHCRRGVTDDLCV